MCGGRRSPHRTPLSMMYHWDHIGNLWWLPACPCNRAPGNVACVHTTRHPLPCTGHQLTPTSLSASTLPLTRPQPPGIHVGVGVRDPAPSHLTGHTFATPPVCLALPIEDCLADPTRVEVVKVDCCRPLAEPGVPPSSGDHC